MQWEDSTSSNKSLLDKILHGIGLYAGIKKDDPRMEFYFNEWFRNDPSLLKIFERYPEILTRQRNVDAHMSDTMSDTPKKINHKAGWSPRPEYDM